MAKEKSDLSRAFSEDGKRKTHVGGQALLEGVMMRGRYNWAVAVREPSGGVYREEHDLKSGAKKNGWMYWPLVRGCRAMVESLLLGYKALEIAALHAFAEEDSDDIQKKSNEGSETTLSEKRSLEALCENEQTPKDVRRSPKDNDSLQNSSKEQFSWKDDFGRPDTAIEALGAQTKLEVIEEHDSPKEVESKESLDESNSKKEASKDDAEFGQKEMALSMVVGLLMGVVLFVVAPALLTNLMVGEYDSNTLLWNLVDGVVRVVIFVFYLWLIGRMKDIKRMFAYHGAEHKTIHCYENGLPLTVENARRFPRLHVRCGTAFLIMVMIISILVYTIVPIDMLISAWGVADGAPTLALVIVARILLMPVIAGISYEITVKWAGSRPENPIVKLILWPGMQMQYLTTNEPDDGQIECAIAAMEQVLLREEVEEKKVGMSSTV